MKESPAVEQLGSATTPLSAGQLLVHDRQRPALHRRRDWRHSENGTGELHTNPLRPSGELSFAAERAETNARLGAVVRAGQRRKPPRARGRSR